MTDNILLQGRVGSHAYGLATADSDEDFLGTYLEPTEEFLGLHPGERGSKVTKDPDSTLHELGKFCKLALGCNPTASELLWLDHYTVKTPVGVELVSLRQSFLSADLVRNSYFEYAAQQFKRLKERGDSFSSQIPKRRVPKHARHMLRLLHQGYKLWSTAFLPVRLELPEAVREFGWTVAAEADQGIYETAERTLSLYENLFNQGRSALPASPDRATIDSWLRLVRMTQGLDNGYMSQLD